MIRYLIDTNVISERRKGRRANVGVQRWFLANSSDLCALSVVTLGEIRRGIEDARRTDLAQAIALESWLRKLEYTFQGQILSVDAEIADKWGRLMSEHKLPDADGWIAATASYYDLTVVTRNVADFERTGVRVLNPFS